MTYIHYFKKSNIKPETGSGFRFDLDLFSHPSIICTHDKLTGQ